MFALKLKVRCVFYKKKEKKDACLDGTGKPASDVIVSCFPFVEKSFVCKDQKFLWWFDEKACKKSTVMCIIMKYMYLLHRYL